MAKNNLTIDVNIEEMNAAIESIEQAYNTFTNTLSEGFSSDLTNLEAMNSDFVDKLIQVVGLIKKWDMDSIDNNIKEYVAAAKSITENLGKSDEALADSFEGNAE